MNAGLTGPTGTTEPAAGLRPANQSGLAGPDASNDVKPSFARTLGVLAGFEKTSQSAAQALATAQGKTSATATSKTLDAKSLPSGQDAEDASSNMQTEAWASAWTAGSRVASSDTAAANSPALANRAKSAAGLAASAKTASKDTAATKSSTKLDRSTETQAADGTPVQATPASTIDAGAPVVAGALPVPVVVTAPQQVSSKANSASKIESKQDGRTAATADTTATSAVDDASAAVVATAPVSTAPIHVDVPAVSAPHAAIAGSDTPAATPVNPLVGVALHTDKVPAATSTSGSDGAAASSPSTATSSSTSETENYSTLVSTPNVLEVGLSSGTHGWLRVRAELSDGGTVAASLTTASTSAYDALHKQLPALTEYLASEHVGLSSLVLDRAPSTADLSSGLAGASTGSGGQTSQNASGEASTLMRDEGPTQDTAGNAIDAIGDTVLSGLAFTGTGLPAYAAGSGGWLNVVA